MMILYVLKFLVPSHFGDRNVQFFRGKYKIFLFCQTFSVFCIFLDYILGKYILHHKNA